MSDFREYFEAAERKVAIARFHATELVRALEEDAESIEPGPSIPVRVQFEGTIKSVVAAIDQVAQGVNSGLGLWLKPNKLFKGAFGAIVEVPGVVAWVGKPIGRDLRIIRSRMVHYACAMKAPPCELVRRT